MSEPNEHVALDVEQVTVGEDEAGERIDTLLAARLDLSRSRIQKLIASEDVEIVEHEAAEPRVPRKSEPVDEGWLLRVRVPPAQPTTLEPEDLELPIIFEDAHLAVVNKPAGMVVHPAPGHRTGTMVHALLHHLSDLSGVGGRLRPGIVHRLDRDTSGLLIVAKTDAAHIELAAAMKRRDIKRLYTAATWGHLDESEMTIEAPLARDPRDRKRMAVVPGGKRAVTRLRVRERWAAAELLDVALQTGRTHQIRVHLAHLGHPVVGDTVYGASWERGMSGDIRPWAQQLARRIPRQFLHAAQLAFAHPITGEPLRFRAPLPDDLAAVVDWVHGTHD